MSRVGWGGKVGKVIVGRVRVGWNDEMIIGCNHKMILL